MTAASHCVNLAPRARASARAGVVMVAAAALAVPIASAVATGPTYTVVNGDHDSTHGVYLRNSPNTNDVVRDLAHEVMWGNHVALNCWVTGSAVGSLNNKMWYRVSVVDGPIKGKTGYLNDHYLNTPPGANQHVGGVPSCTAPTPAPQPAPTPTPKPNPAPAPAPTPTSAPTPNPAPAPPPKPVPASPGVSAAAWAKNQVGSSRWEYLCLSFVRSAWTHAHVDIRSISSGWQTKRSTYPLDIWKKFKAGTWGTGKPPKSGALLFFSDPYTGLKRIEHSHIEVYVGNNTNVSSGYVTSRFKNATHVHYEGYGKYWGGKYYLGWWYPAK